MSSPTAFSNLQSPGHGLARHGGVPQTLAEAYRAGWRWVIWTCEKCNHVGSLEIEPLLKSRGENTLARLNRSAVCVNCSRKVAAMTLARFKLEAGEFPDDGEERLAFWSVKSR